MKNILILTIFSILFSCRSNENKIINDKTNLSKIDQINKKYGVETVNDPAKLKNAKVFNNVEDYENDLKRNKEFFDKIEKENKENEDFINEIKIENIYKHELELINYIQNKLLELPEVVLYGVSNVKAGVISFNIKNNHPFDVGTLLDKYGIAVRTGHHCTQPLMQFLQIPGTVRVSFAVYNTKQEIDFFIEKLKKVILMLS
jgi:hypothetical protein